MKKALILIIFMISMNYLSLSKCGGAIKVKTLQETLDAVKWIHNNCCFGDKIIIKDAKTGEEFEFINLSIDTPIDCMNWYGKKKPNNVRIV